MTAWTRGESGSRRREEVFAAYWAVGIKGTVDVLVISVRFEQAHMTLVTVLILALTNAAEAAFVAVEDVIRIGTVTPQLAYAAVIARQVLPAPLTILCGTLLCFAKEAKDALRGVAVHAVILSFIVTSTTGVPAPTARRLHRTARLIVRTSEHLRVFFLKNG